MEGFRFNPENGDATSQFGGVKAIISQALQYEKEAVISTVYIQPGVKIGYHQAGTPHLFLFVQGQGRVRGGDGETFSVEGGQAIFWEQGEWYEVESEQGMIAVIIDRVYFDPENLMPLLQRDEP